MTPPPDADEPAAQMSGGVLVVAAERGLSSGIPANVEPGHDDCAPAPRPNRPDAGELTSADGRVAACPRDRDQRWR
jgi:hypothetical protein